MFRKPHADSKLEGGRPRPPTSYRKAADGDIRPPALGLILPLVIGMVFTVAYGLPTTQPRRVFVPAPATRVAVPQVTGMQLSATHSRFNLAQITIASTKAAAPVPVNLENALVLNWVNQSDAPKTLGTPAELNGKTSIIILADEIQMLRIHR